MSRIASRARISSQRGRWRSGLAALIAAVLLVHLVVAGWLREQLDAVGREADEPKRMSVAYVRELKPTAPVAHLAAAVAPPKLAPVKPRRAPVVAPSASASASAAEVGTAASAASPAQVPEPSVVAATEGVAASTPSANAASSPEGTARDEALAAQAAASPASGASSPSEPSIASVASADQAASAASSSPSSTSSPAASTLPATSAATDAKPFEWPESTRLTYTLTGNYRGDVYGNAQVEWIRDQAHYQVHLDVVVGPSFAPLFTRKMTSDGQITPRGLAPRRYDEDSKLAFQARRVNSVVFENDAVVLANGTRVARPDEVTVQDSASQFVQLTWLFSTRPDLLEVGRSIEVPLALPRSLDTWVYDVFERETLDTPFGALEALHLKPRKLVPSSNARTNALTAEIWFAPTLAYLPARIVIHQDADTYVDLMISRLPQLAAPMRGSAGGAGKE